MYLPANIFFSLNDFFNCLRIIASPSIIKRLQQVVGIIELLTAGFFVDFLFRSCQIVFVMPIVIRMNFVDMRYRFREI